MKRFHPDGTLRDGADPVRLTPNEAGWEYCGLRVLDLPEGGSRTVDLGDAEAAVVPLTGSCAVEIDAGPRFELSGRSSVFSAPTDLCYLPRRSLVKVSSPRGGRFAVATAEAEDSRPARYLPAGDVGIELRGAGQASRQINDLLSADVAGPQRLMVVEVLTPAGNWSSYPPHKHDEWGDREVPLEEIYYFRLRGDGGFGFHRTYTKDGEVDDTLTVADGDVYVIPKGFHGPCVAAPGYDMYYLNVMAGPDPERRWLICTDPDHAWVLDHWRHEAIDGRLPMYA